MVTSVIRALRHRNFRLFFVGQGISLIGTWMQSVAMPWLVYRLTGSVVLLGVVGFTSQILTFVLAPVGGVLADRWDKRRLVIACQVLAMVQALALAALTLSGLVQVWHVVALSFLTGFVRAFEVPTRQSFVIEMLDDRADLPNAIALNSFLVNGARLIGPSLAGILVVLFGEGWCFLANGLSYVAVIVALAAMRVAVRRMPPPTTNVFGGLKEGVAYAFRTPALRSILLLVGIVSLVGVPYQTLMPVFAREVLSGGPDTFGYMVGATGVGALSGAVFLASRKNVRGLGRVIVLAAACFGTGLIAFGLSQSFWLDLVVLAWAGAAMMLQMASSNTLLQTIAEEGKRGRVMSFYTMMFMGMVPFGALAAGWMANHLGAPLTVVIGGALCLAGTAVLGWRLPALTEPFRPEAAVPGAAGFQQEGVAQ